MFSWDRLRTETETTTEEGWESSLEAQKTGKASRDITHEVTKNEAWKLTSAGINVGIGEAVNIGADLQGAFGTEITAVDRDTTTLISEATAPNRPQGTWVAPEPHSGEP